jgi:hypothetical protein
MQKFNLGKLANYPKNPPENWSFNLHKDSASATKSSASTH